MLPPKDGDAPRTPAYGDPWHGVTAAIVAACRANGVLPVDGPFGDFSDPDGFTAQARRVGDHGHGRQMGDPPAQVALANEVFTPRRPRSPRPARSSPPWPRPRPGPGRGHLQGPADRHRLGPPGPGDRRDGRADRGLTAARRLQSGPGRDQLDTRAGSERACRHYLDFEKGLAEIEGKAEELRTLARKNTEMNVEDEAARSTARPRRCSTTSTATSTPGGRRWSRATRTGRTARTTSRRCSASGRRSPATATSPTTTR